MTGLAYQLLRGVFGRIVTRQFEARVEGEASLDGAAIVVANHPNSSTDAALLAQWLPRPSRFVVDDRLLRMAGIGRWLRAAGAIGVERGSEAGLDSAMEALAAGEVVVLFPEGKLSHERKLRPFRGGLERLAARAGAAGLDVPIVPVTLRYEDRDALGSRVTLNVGALHRFDPHAPQGTLTRRVRGAMKLALHAPEAVSAPLGGAAGRRGATVRLAWWLAARGRVEARRAFRAALATPAVIAVGVASVLVALASVR